MTLRPARHTLAAALCDATNGKDAYLSITNAGRTSWLHRADAVIRELAKQDWMCVAMEDLERVEAQDADG